MFHSQALTLQGKFKFTRASDLLSVVWIFLQKWRGPATPGCEPGPTICNKTQVAFLPAFLSRVFQFRRILVFTIEAIGSVINCILTFIPVSCM